MNILNVFLVRLPRHIQHLIEISSDGVDSSSFDVLRLALGSARILVQTFFGKNREAWALVAGGAYGATHHRSDHQFSRISRRPKSTMSYGEIQYVTRIRYHGLLTSLALFSKAE